MLARFRKRDTTMAAALSEAGINRARRMIAEKVRNERRTGRADDHVRRQVAAFVLRDRDLLLEIIGGEAAFDKMVGAYIATLPRDDEGRGLNECANDGQVRSATPSSTNGGAAGHENPAGDGQLGHAAAPPSNRDGSGQVNDASDSQRSVAAPSRLRTPVTNGPQRTAATLRAYQPVLLNSLLRTYMVAGRPIGDYTVAEALDISTRRLSDLARDAVPYRVLKAAAQKYANAPAGETIGAVCTDADIEAYIKDAEALAHA